MAHNRVIGNKGDMPWHMPADLARFKRLTRGHAVIMGRRTFESIGRPLPDLQNIVLSKNAAYNALGCAVVTSLEEALQALNDGDADQEEVFIIGGQQLYAAALPSADKLYLTHIDAAFPGDTYFPAYPQDDWRLISSESHVADEKNPWPYRFDVLER